MKTILAIPRYVHLNGLRGLYGTVMWYLTGDLSTKDFAEFIQYPD